MADKPTGNPAPGMCRVPLSARYEIVDGKAVMLSAEYEDVSADFIARFLIEKFGYDAIFGGGDNS